MVELADPLLTRAIDSLASRRDLSSGETAAVLSEIMHGEASEIQIAAFLIALRTKGETVDELAGLARTMRELAAHVPTDREDLLDTAGTGGGRSTFNVSTTAALIAAGAGCAVAKHGNRSATSRSGSADVLEALGARIDLGPEQVARCIDEAGFGFMFAPAHHQATRFVIPVRSALAVRTVFNMLGPLTNPAGASRQLVGVSDPAFLGKMGGALGQLGVVRALVVSSEDGLDEVSCSAPTHVVELNEGELRSYVLDPEDAGVQPDGGELLAGGTPAENAARTLAILQPGVKAPPGEALAAINAGAAIYAAGAAASIAEGVLAAREAIADGRALAALDGYVAASRRHAPRGDGVSGATGTVLDRILAETREAVARRRAERPLPEPASAAGFRGGRFREALAAPGVGVIAEFKRRSPSAGSLHEAPDLETILAAYERGGAAAASILTEEPNFGGSLEDLASARRACDLPLLRKDFVIDAYQLREALAAGADAVLLIVAALGDGELAALHDEAGRLGLDVLVEVHDALELERAAAVGAEIIGVNNRDLRDFSVDLARTGRLMAGMPPGAIVVSESGISTAAQLAELESRGVDAVLVGEALMRAPDPAVALVELRSS